MKNRNGIVMCNARNTIYHRYIVGNKLTNKNNGINYTISVVKQFENGYLYVFLVEDE